MVDPYGLENESFQLPTLTVTLPSMITLSSMFHFHVFDDLYDSSKLFTSFIAHKAYGVMTSAGKEADFCFNLMPSSLAFSCPILGSPGSNWTDARISQGHQKIDSYFGTNMGAALAPNIEWTHGYIPFGPPAATAATFSRQIAAIERINPHAIKFSQPTVSQNFSNGRTISELIEGLKSGAIRVEDIPAIRVVEKGENLITLDNRRLVAFQNAKIESIPIQRVSLNDAKILDEFRNKNNPIKNGDLIVIIPNASQRKAEELLLRSRGKIN